MFYTDKKSTTQACAVMHEDAHRDFAAIDRELYTLDMARRERRRFAEVMDAFEAEGATVAADCHAWSRGWQV